MALISVGMTEYFAEWAGRTDSNVRICRPVERKRQSADQTIETSCGGSAWYSYFTAPFVIVYSASIEDFALMPSQLRLYSQRLRVVTLRQAFPIGA
jgi:hypothetical protein